MDGSGNAPDVCTCGLCKALSRLRREGHHPNLPKELGAYVTGKVRELHAEVLDYLETSGVNVRLAPPVAEGVERAPLPQEQQQEEGKSVAKGSGVVKTEEPDFDGEAVATVAVEESTDPKGVEEPEEAKEVEEDKGSTEAPVEAESAAKEVEESEPKEETHPKEKKKDKKEKKDKKDKRRRSKEPGKKESKQQQESVASGSRPSRGSAKSSGRKRKRRERSEEEKSSDSRKVRERKKERREERTPSSTKEAAREKSSPRRSRSKGAEERGVRLEENKDHRRPRSPDHPPPAHLQARRHEDRTSAGWSTPASSPWRGPPGYWGGQDREKHWKKSKGVVQRNRWKDIIENGPCQERKKQREGR